MSWWDTKNLTSFASQALKNAQKTIDKVLDIQEDGKGQTVPTQTKVSEKADPEVPTSKDEGEFFNSWLSATAERTKKNTAESTEKGSSWSMPSFTADSAQRQGRDSKNAGSKHASPSKRQKGKAESSEKKETSSSDIPTAITLTPEKFSRRPDKKKRDTRSPKLEAGTFHKTDVTEPKTSILKESSVPKSSLETDTLAPKQSIPVSNPALRSNQEKSSALDSVLKVIVPEERIGKVKPEKDQEIGLLMVAKDEPSMLPREPETNQSEAKDKSISAEDQSFEEGYSDDVTHKSPRDGSPCLQEQSLNKTEEVQQEGRSYYLDDGKEEVPSTDMQNKSEETEIVVTDYQEQRQVMEVSTPEDTYAKSNDAGLGGNVEENIDMKISDHKTLDSPENVNTEDIEKMPVVDLKSDSDECYHLEESVENYPKIDQIHDEIVGESDTQMEERLNMDHHDHCDEIKDAEMDDLNIDVGLGVLQSHLVSNTGEAEVVVMDTAPIPAQGDTSVCDISSSVEIVQEADIFAVESLTDISQMTDNSQYECQSGLGQDESKDEQTEAVEIAKPEFNISESDLDESSTALGIHESTSIGRMESTDSETSKLDSSMDTGTSDDTVVDRDIGVQGDSVNSDDGSDEGGKSDKSSTSSSFVKCMLEDAMEDAPKIEDNGSDSPSTGGDKSEYSRSHESSDEIDTTTSSDIEIISTPTPNGDKDRPFDLSPLRIALQKTARRGSPTMSHRRTDSQSSSSTQSKDGHPDQMSPGRENLDRHDVEGVEDWKDPMSSWRRSSYDEHRSRAELPALDEEDDNPYHPQRLLKKLAEMAEILQARESKLIQISKENADLFEANTILRNQLQQSEEAREVEMTDLNNLTAEFGQRIGEADKKLQSVLKEKETVKKQLQLAQDEIIKRSMDTSHEMMLQEKDQQIAELLQEGEKLSKQQLQTNTIIKKLRSKEKENDSVLSTQKKKLEEQKTEVEHLRKVLDSKEEMENKQTEAISQLNLAVQKQEKELIRLKSDLDDAEEKTRGLQAALDNSYKEIAELHRSNAAQDSKAQEVVLSTEMQLREELKQQMEKERHRYKQEKEALVLQIEDLRMSMSRMEKDQSRREDMLRQEISDLHVRLQEDEARNQELTSSVTSATRPLLRQIENLQSTYAAQSSSWEKVEKNITDRLVETQTQLAATVERERLLNEKLLDMSTKQSTMESQNSHLRQEKSQLTAKLEMTNARVEVLEDAKNSEAAQVEAVRQKMSQDLMEIRKEKVFLETQLDTEKTKLEQEKKKMTLAQEQIKDLEQAAQRPQSRGTPSPISVSRQESVNSYVEAPWSPTQEDLERSFLLATANGNRQSLYESLRQSGAANLLENLQSQLKQREGEILHFQGEIQQLERTRESMARELVNLSNKNDELKEHVEELPELRQQYQELDGRYNALLQMYGEKVEEANELRMDLNDVKEMYKMQIDHLLAR